MRIDKLTAKYAFMASLPVFAGYVVLGIGFGLLLFDKGYGVWWALAMSVFIFAGSLQYVGVSMIASGAGFIACAITSLMVNLRHLFYGISMLDEYKKCGKERIYDIFALSDETFSLVVSPELPEGVNKRGYYFLVSLLDQSYWVLGTLIGSLLGQIIPFSTEGVDFSMTALFIVVVVDQWEKASQHISALVGFASAFVCLLIFGGDNFLIPTMVCITILLFVMKSRLSGGKEQS